MNLSTNALFKRINRCLAREGECLRRLSEGRNGFHELGPIYRVDVHRRVIVDKWVDLEALGRELRVIRHGEVVVTT